MKTAGLINLYKKYFAIFLVVIVGGLILNNMLFMHSHFLSDGEIIVHAHPFNKTQQAENPLQQHQHTKGEILFFNSLLLLFTVAILCLFTASVRKWVPLKSHYFYSVLENKPQIIANKAPPSFSF
ncbi:MAG: hypothetical protein RBR68_00715 [Tenuifilaceae bacterium]|nr:hypothetical protein [Tenuifilaceae bacterium]